MWHTLITGVWLVNTYASGIISFFVNLCSEPYVHNFLKSVESCYWRVFTVLDKTPIVITRISPSSARYLGMNTGLRDYMEASHEGLLVRGFHQARAEWDLHIQTTD